MSAAARAFLIASDRVSWATKGDPPLGLVPLVDRPLAQHVVESLVGQGVDELDIVLHHGADQLEQALGDGTRWGVTIRYHLTRDPERPYLPFQVLTCDEPLLLGHIDRLPLTHLLDQRPRDGAAVMFDSGPGYWSGWAWLDTAKLADCGDVDVAGLEAALREAGAVSAPVATVLDARSARALLDAQQALLEGAGEGLLRSGRETEPGIRISANVSLHPTARLTAPVFIGRDCQIGAGAQLGPGAVICRGSILDEGATVSESLIMPGSYVGQQIAVERSIVDRNQLTNVALGATIDVTDDFILGAAEAPRVLEGLAWGALRLATVPAVLLGLPLVLLGRLRARGELLQLPAGSRRRTYRATSLLRGRPACTLGDLVLRVWPGLFDVMLGRVRLVGVEPLSPEAVERLPADWRMLYLSAKGGLISEGLVRCPELSGELRRSADVCYAVTSNWRHDVSLLLLYLGQVARGFAKRAGLSSVKSVATRQIPAPRANHL